MEPYNKNKPTVSWKEAPKNKSELLERLQEAGVPFTAALKYFYDNPEGPASETLNLATDETVPFKWQVRTGNATPASLAKEAIMFGLPVPGPKSTRTINTPNGVIELKLNSKVPLLDESMNAEFNRLNNIREDVNWREKSDYDSDPWYGMDNVKELGDEISPEAYKSDWGSQRYESNSIHPDDFNSLIDEYYADSPEYFEENYGNPDDIKFKPGSQEFAEAEANAIALDKLYSEMNNDNALISNVDRINRDRESALSNAYWKAYEDIYNKYKNPEYEGSYSFLEGKYAIPSDWTEGNIKSPLVKAFPDYETYRKYIDEVADLKSRPSQFKYTPNEADIKPAEAVYDYVLNDPNLLQYEDNIPGRSPIYARLLDKEYRYEPNSIFSKPSSKFIDASLDNYKEPFRMTVGDFDEISKAVDAKRLNKYNYNETWTDNLKKEIDLLDNDMISDKDKSQMKEEIDRIAPEIFSTSDETRRKYLLRALQNNLEAMGLNWVK